MNRHRAVLALWMMVALSGLLSILTGILGVSIYRMRTAYSMEQGIDAAYAAESGAQWALVYLSGAALPDRYEEEAKIGGDTSFKVIIEKVSFDEEKNIWKGKVRSRGVHDASGTLRYLQLDVTVEGEEVPRRIMVTDLQKWKW